MAADPRRQAIGVVAALALGAACHAVKTPASVVNVADRATASQLVSGFYNVEMNAWRWTAPQFTVALGPPRGAAKNGAKLVLRLFVPPAQLEELGPMTLTAVVAGLALDPETYSTPGSYSYTRNVPADLLDTNVVPVNFRFDKSAPAEQGGRQLGVVVAGIELQPKQL